MRTHHILRPMNDTPSTHEFFVHASDGRDYPTDLAALREWVRSNRIRPDQYVYSSATGQWMHARDVAQLRDLFTSRSQNTRSSPLPIGLLATIGVIVAAGFAIMLGFIVQGSSHSTGSASQSTPLASPETMEPPAAHTTPAQQRVAAAAALQHIFDESDFKGWQLAFAARGNRCDVLHVEGDVNLYPEMMEALGHGTVAYGKVLPGGVNQYAFNAGFRDVVYTNPGNAKYRAFGSSKLTGAHARKARRCTDAIAAALDPAAEQPVVRPEAPDFVQLSWDNAAVGTRLYDGSYRYDATILSLDRPNDLMKVRYRSGAVEPKQLSAVAPYWYVNQK